MTVTASPSIEEQGCRFFTQDEWTRATAEERAFIKQCDQSLRPSPEQASSASSGNGGLSNDRYYKNKDNIDVHSPAHSTDGSVPAGATAICADGSYSFRASANRLATFHTWQLSE
jgi:Protein of unknown function (DUF3761)